jgi:two-component system, chemotaxis family, response regulator Rcp1
MKPLNILLAEDNIHDVNFILTALAQSKFNSKVEVVGDGSSCIDYLNKIGVYKSAIPPDLIILDMNMPSVDGIEVLKVIKYDVQFKKIPIIAFTSSNEKSDIGEAYDNYVNSYVVKPMDPKLYSSIVREIEKFWIVVSELPQ